MSNQTVTVSPGGATLLASSLASGSTIYNQDSNNAVWVSSHPDVAPGYGIPVQPLGTATWAGGPVYAVVDAGVTATVTLSLSSDVTSTNNPIAVGAAVAAKLLAQGVPSVLLGKLLVSATVNNTGTYVVPFDVSKYANLSIHLVSIANPNQYWKLAYSDSGSSTIVYQKGYIQTPANTEGIFLDSAPRGDRLAITWTNTAIGAISIVIYGTNRVAPERLTNTPNYFTSTIPSQAYAAFQSVQFPDTFYTAGGLHNIHLTPNAVNAKGYLNLNLLDSLGNPVSVTILDSASAGTGPSGETEITGQFTLPAGKYTMNWQNGSTGMTYATTINITPPN